MNIAFGVMHRIASGIFALGAAASMAAVFLVVFVNSALRYTYGRSFEWGEELPIYLAIYGVMFGAALAYLQDRHVRFTVVTDLLPRQFRLRLFVLVDLLMIGIGALLAYSGYLFIQQRGDVEASGIVGLASSLAELTGFEFVATLGLMAPYQAALVFGGGMIALAALLRFLARIADHQGRWR